MSHIPEFNPEPDRIAAYLQRITESLGAAAGRLTGRVFSSESRAPITTYEGALGCMDFQLLCREPATLVQQWPFEHVPSIYNREKTGPWVTPFNKLDEVPASRLVVVEGMPLQRGGEEGTVRFRPMDKIDVLPGQVSRLELDVPELALLRGVRMALSVRLGEIPEESTTREASIVSIHAIEPPIIGRQTPWRHRPATQGSQGYVQGAVVAKEGVGVLHELTIEDGQQDMIDISFGGKLVDYLGDSPELAIVGKPAVGDYVRVRVEERTAPRQYQAYGSVVYKIG